MPSGEFEDSATTFWSNKRESFIVPDRVTFAQFDSIPEQLGFQKKVIRGSQVKHENPGSG